MNNLKSFDLARWRAGDEIMYRDGKEVLDMHYYEHPGLIFPIRSLSYDGRMNSHLPDGRFYKSGFDHYLDIVMKPKKIKWYFASWDSESEEVRSTTGLFVTKHLVEDWAKEAIVSNLLIHEIEIEE